MKIVKSTAVKPVSPIARTAGIITEYNGKHYLTCVVPGLGLYIANLLTGATGVASMYLNPGERELPDAAFCPDGVPLPPPAPVPVPKSKEQHAQEFIKYYWDNTGISGASNITTYSVGDILEGRTNVNTRRAFSAWLAARGV